MTFSDIDSVGSQDFVKMLEKEWKIASSNMALEEIPTNILSPVVTDKKTGRPEKEEVELKKLPSAGLSDKLKFQAKFQLEGDELLDCILYFVFYSYLVFKCANLRSALIQGKMYVSRNYLCFSGKSLGLARLLVLPFRDIIKIEKQGFQSHWLLNAIGVKTQTTEVMMI